MKKLIYLFILVLFSSSSLLAQKYIVSGKVQDAESSDPIPFAQVAFYKSGQNTAVAGNTTNQSGSFKIP